MTDRKGLRERRERARKEGKCDYNCELGTTGRVRDIINVCFTERVLNVCAYVCVRERVRE